MEFFQIVWVSGLLSLGVFIPGFALSLYAYPKGISHVERLGFSFVLGFIPPLILYFLAKNFWIPIDFTSAPLMILAVTVFGFVGYHLKTSK